MSRMSKHERESRRSERLTTDEAVELAAGVAELAKAGLPLAPGLRALAGELSGRRLPGVLREMASQLEAGGALDAVVAAQGRRLPPHLRGLITAGVHSGRLANVLEEFVDLERNRIDLRRRVWLSMAYPLLLLAMVFALFVFVEVGLVRTLGEFLSEFGVNLPGDTQFAIWLSGPGLWTVVGGIGGLAVLALSLWAAGTWLPQGGQPMYYIPLLGAIWRYSRMARFVRLLGLLLQQGIVLPKALRLTAAGIGRGDDLARSAAALADDVESGRSLAQGVGSRGQFPRSLVPLIDWGERNSTLPDALKNAGDVFEARAQSRAGVLEAIAPPIACLIVVGSAWFLLRTMYAPLIALLQGIM